MTGGHTVLVVDDEAGMRETLTEILTAEGYGVRLASDGVAALEQLTLGEVDVVVMDVRMPRLDGVSTLKRIGAPPPQVILMTGFAFDEQLAEAVDAQVFAVVQKPFHVRFLLELVERAAGAAA